MYCPILYSLPLYLTDAELHMFDSTLGTDGVFFKFMFIEVLFIGRVGV
jgi:hypothetical protein